MKIVRLMAVLVAMALAAMACGGGSDGGGGGAASSGGVRLGTTDAGLDLLENPPEGLVVLDVRTPQEFDAGHIEDAVLIDFYEADFADRIAELDRDTPYLLYCNSGNRSGQTATLMSQLGFADVLDVDGGITAWAEAGHPITQ